jgi:RNA polymerase sigma-70 factor (ECF subfamily)
MIVNLINTMVELMYVTPTHLHDLSTTSDMLVLIDRMAKRDESSLAAFYDLTLSKVYGLALKITRRHDLAEDVVVDTYWQAWHQSVRFDISRGVPMAWLMLICRTRALDALRKLDEAGSHPEPSELIVESEFLCPTLEKMLTLERDSALHVAMAKLSAIQRQLIALAFFKGYTHQEISEQINLPLGSVKSHIKRAQSSLKDALSHQEA